MSPRCVDCRLLNLAVCAIPTVTFSTFFCFRRRWRCKCSHCESLGFSITNGWLRVDWAHQTCNLHVLRSTKRLREAEDLRGFCVAFSASRLLTFSSAHMSASTWPQQPFLGSSRTSRRQPARTSSRNHLSTIEVGAVVTARCACCSSTEDCPLDVAPSMSVASS